MVSKTFWSGKKVLVTGHTGFKGAWLSLWLKNLGADVVGYSLAPGDEKCLFNALKLSKGYFNDIRDRSAMCSVLAREKPEIIFHMAAQSLVRQSYLDPLETFSTNIMGTATLLDCVRCSASVSAVIVVTSDKCYENHEWIWPYRESDQLGGKDPYSASKGACELVVSSIKKSFFEGPNGHPAKVATVRSGNVFGGGDWSEDRLIPDIVRGLEIGTVDLRNPGSVRPWQHVFEPLSGYMTFACKLVNDDSFYEPSMNFGPVEASNVDVMQLCKYFLKHFSNVNIRASSDDALFAEAGRLTLDSSRARNVLGWSPKMSLEEGVDITAGWYQAYKQEADMVMYSSNQISDFERL